MGDIKKDTYLERFYKSLYENILRHRTLLKDSVLLTLMDVKSNVRSRLINGSEIQSFKIPKMELHSLKEKQYIRLSDQQVDRYVITSQGIWQIERKKGVLDEKRLLEFINEKWLTFKESEKPLGDKEKIILLSMIAGRAFSEHSPVNLKLGDLALDAWASILKGSYEFLREKNIVAAIDINQLIGKIGLEHPVSHLIRHSDALPKKTKGIYLASGSQNYFLKIYDNSELSESKLTYLFGLIFNNFITIELYESIIKFCREVAFDKSFYVFDLDKHIFNKPKFDDIIERSLRSLLS